MSTKMLRHDRSYLLLKSETKIAQQGKLINLLSVGTLFGELAFAKDNPTPHAAAACNF